LASGVTTIGASRFSSVTLVNQQHVVTTFDQHRSWQKRIEVLLAGSNTVGDNYGLFGLIKIRCDPPGCKFDSVCNWDS
jgi:hypothetical protein